MVLRNMTTRLFLVLLLLAQKVQAREHPDDNNGASSSKTSRMGCCSRNYKDCLGTSVSSTLDTVVTDELRYSQWYCGVPEHCGKVAGCMDLVWLGAGHVFDASCLGHRQGTCTGESSEGACCFVQGLEGEQLKCDTAATQTCLLPHEIAAHQSAVAKVTGLNLLTRGFEESHEHFEAEGCCSYDHKSCDVTGYCNWKERCGIESVSLSYPGAPPKVTFKDDHCKDFMWFPADQVLGYNVQKPYDTCAGRQADTCDKDEDCCPGLYCNRVDVSLGAAGYSHCAWSIDKV